MSSRASLRTNQGAAGAGRPAASPVLGDDDIRIADELDARDALAYVGRRGGELRHARTLYREAIVAAVELLEEQGCRSPFSRVAEAAGVSRQSLRVLVGRARAGC